MRIGILGSGLMGGKLGTIFARAGHEVVFSYSHSERKLKRLAREAGGHARAGTPREAALDTDALLFAVHWSRVADVLKQAGDLSGKAIISCSLPMNASDTALAVARHHLAPRCSRGRFARRTSSPHSVYVPSEVLFDVFGAKRRRRRRPSLMFCGDDRDAKKIAATLIRDVGFEPVDTGLCESRDTWSRSPWRWLNSRKGRRRA